MPMAEHVAVAASSVQQEAATMAASNKTFASRWPPKEQPPEAKAAWDAMVLGFYVEKVEARNAGRKLSMSQKEWWSMYGHTMTEAKKRKILTKPSASASNRVGEEGEEAEAPPGGVQCPAEEHEHEEDDEEKKEESEDSTIE